MFAVFDPQPFRNDYVSRMFLAPMLDYASRNNLSIRRVDSLTPETGHTLICNADYLTPEVIRRFKQNDVRMVAVSCIDSAYLAESFRHAPEMLLIDRIFAVTGVQNTNTSNATVIDAQFNITAEPRTFLPDEDWQRFDEMRQSGRLLSLPYVPWEVHAPPARMPFRQRRPTALFRGGNHFFRVLAWMKAMSVGVADGCSGFQTRAYFDDRMNPQFRYCDACRAAFRSNGNRYPIDAQPGECTSEAEWGGDDVRVHPTGRWNNRCLASFYWLARKFHERHGGIDMAQVENAMNFYSQQPVRHLQTINECRFYADSKWEFSINAAQRFWEAASVGTINLIPRRANDQDYFPPIKDGEHYLTFSDDFSDISAEIDEERFQRISDNAHALWKRWIKPTDYAISTNLLKWIFDQCAF